jgi:hypothetical protein
MVTMRRRGIIGSVTDLGFTITEHGLPVAFLLTTSAELPGRGLVVSSSTVTFTRWGEPIEIVPPVD